MAVDNDLELCDGCDGYGELCPTCGEIPDNCDCEETAQEGTWAVRISAKERGSANGQQRPCRPHPGSYARTAR